MSTITLRPASRKRKRPFWKRLAFQSSVKRMRTGQRPGAVASVSRLYKGPFAQTVTCTHKYVDFWALNASAGLVAFDSWSLNNIFDPYDAAGGHQPLGFDQMAALYTKWVVIEAEIKVVCYTAPGNQIPIVLRLCPGGQEITSNTEAFDAVAEKPNTSYFPTTSTRNWLKRKVNIKKFFGKAYDAGEQQGSSSAGPTGGAELIAQVGYGPMDSASDLAAAGGLVEIVYKVQWSQPKTVTQS